MYPFWGMVFNILRFGPLLIFPAANAGGVPFPVDNPLPHISVSDSWTYQSSGGKFGLATRIMATVVGVRGDGLTIQYRVQGSLDQIADTIYDTKGRIVQLANPLEGEVVKYSPPSVESAWPLRPGKVWESETTERAAHWQCHSRSRYQVIGWETIRVLAGTFNTIKVTWLKTIDEGIRETGASFSGEENGTYWYSPDARAVVQVEYRDRLGLEYRRELVTYHAN